MTSKALIEFCVSGPVRKVLEKMSCIFLNIRIYLPKIHFCSFWLQFSFLLPLKLCFHPSNISLKKTIVADRPFGYFRRVFHLLCASNKTSSQTGNWCVILRLWGWLNHWHFMSILFIEANNRVSVQKKVDPRTNYWACFSGIRIFSQIPSDIQRSDFSTRF